MIGNMSIISTIMNLNDGIDIKVNEAVGKCPGRNYTHEEFKNVPKSGTFFFCTIEEAKYLQDMMLGTVAYSRSAFDVHEWLPMIGTNALNWHGSYYLHAGQLSDREIGMFCRSDSGDKAWAGQMIKDTNDVDLVKDQVQRDEILFVAPRREFSAEWRLWMIEGKCVASSRYVNPFAQYAEPDWPYKSDDELRQAAIEFAEWLADQVYEPDDMYVVDVARAGSANLVVEYNAFSTSGWHDADPERLIQAVERHFQS